MQMSFSQTLLGLNFANPIICASGKWAWTAEHVEELCKAGAGGITTKSFWNHMHVGNQEPVLVQTETWTLNAVGLPDFGPEHSSKELTQMLAHPTVPIIVSILGLTAEEYAENAARIAALRPSAVEVNLSSPTFLKLKGTFFDADEAAAIIPAVKKEIGSIPVFVKLSPNIPDIGAFAARCVSAGADGITAINTLGTGLAIDLETRKPILSAKRGGISGSGIKPLAVRCIADIYEATEGKTPIIGVGGVMTGEDAIELMMAGANLVGLASALLRDGSSAFPRIQREMEYWAASHGVQDISELVGAIHM